MQVLASSSIDVLYEGSTEFYLDSWGQSKASEAPASALSAPTEPSPAHTLPESWHILVGQ